MSVDGCVTYVNSRERPTIMDLRKRGRNWTHNPGIVTFSGNLAAYGDSNALAVYEPPFPQRGAESWPPQASLQDHPHGSPQPNSPFVGRRLQAVQSPRLILRVGEKTDLHFAVTVATSDVSPAIWKNSAQLAEVVFSWARNCMKPERRL